MSALDGTLIVSAFSSDLFTDDLAGVIQKVLPDVNGLSCGNGELHVNLYLDRPDPGPLFLESVTALEAATGFHVSHVEIFDSHGENPERCTIDQFRLLLQLQQQIPSKPVVNLLWDRVAN